jgi:hypothetical protein
MHQAPVLTILAATPPAEERQAMALALILGVVIVLLLGLVLLTAIRWAARSRAKGASKASVETPSAWQVAGQRAEPDGPHSDGDLADDDTRDLDPPR